MPVLGRTRTQLRQAVGDNLPNALTVSSASAQGTTATLVDNTLTLGATSEYRGRWIVFTSAPNLGSISRVTSSAIASFVTTHTFYPARTQTESGNTYELWSGYDPARINRFLDQAMIDAGGKFYDPVESLALHGDGRQTRFDVPSGLAMIKEVEYRTSVEGEEIHACDAAWDESVAANVTVVRDTEDYKRGGASVRLFVDAAVAGGTTLATDNFSAKDLSGYDYIEFWIKCSSAVTAGYLRLYLDNTASSVSPIENLSIPALTADTWTFVRIALATPELDTAIISVGLRMQTDINEAYVWLDDIRAVLQSTAHWKELHPRMWDTDQEAQDLILLHGAEDYIGDCLIKLTGGDTPALLTAEGSTSEVPEEYVIARATELALLSESGGPTTDPDNRRQLASYWAERARDAYRAFPINAGIRTVS